MSDPKPNHYHQYAGDIADCERCNAPDASWSSVPEAARAAKERRQLWRDLAWLAQRNGNTDSVMLRLMRAADAEVAAASVELRQEVDRLSAECEALRGTVAEERATTGRLREWIEKRIDLYADAPHNEGCEGEPECAACWVADLRAALASPGEES